jgi:hypothetical protein
MRSVHVHTKKLGFGVLRPATAHKPLPTKGLAKAVCPATGALRSATARDAVLTRTLTRDRSLGSFHWTTVG